MEWGKTLWMNKDLDEDVLLWLLNEMKWGRWEYDQRLGIQNITLALPWIEKTDRGYRRRQMY